MPGWGVALRVRVPDWETELAESEKTGHGAAKPVGMGEGFVQAAWTTDVKGNNSAQARPITTEALYIYMEGSNFQKKGRILRGRTYTQPTKTPQGK